MLGLGYCLSAGLGRAHYNKLNLMQVEAEHQQWIKPELMIKLLTEMTHQYREESYEVNKVARSNIQALEPETDKAVHEQILTFCQVLGGSPKYFLELLNEEVISSQTHIITLNSRNGQVVRRLFSDFQIITKITEPKQYKQHAKLHEAVMKFVNIVARRISNVYQKTVDKISSQMEKLIDKVKTSRMMNNFLLYKIFRELSDSIKKKTISYATDAVFRNCPKEAVQDFYQYTINKFETIKLFANQELKDNIFEPNPSMMLSSLQKNFRIEIILKEALREDGVYGIFVNPNSSHPELKKSLEDYIIYIEEKQKLRIINCKTLRKQWYIIGNFNCKFKLQKMAMTYIVEGQSRVDSARSKSDQPLNKLFDCKPLQNFTNLDGVIGRCLYLMKEYHQPSDFFKDFSKRAVLSKSIQQIMLALPIVGFFLAASTFTKAFYQIFSNHFSTDSKKLAEVTGFLMRTGATMGSSVLGAIVGQTLIPIPFLGALVGTVVGGMLGERGCRQVTSMIEQDRFIVVVDFLRDNIKDGCRWQCSVKLYQLLDIKPVELINYIPKYMDSNVFITLVGFVVICFHESTCLTKFNTEKQKQLEQSQSYKPKKQTENLSQKQKQFEDDINRLNDGKDYKTQFDLSAIINYLQKNNARVYDHFDVMEQSILSFITKIIP